MRYLLFPPQPRDRNSLTNPHTDRFGGPGALAFLSHLLPASLSNLPVPGTEAHRPFGSTLSVLLNEEGGILDDCMITRWGEDRCVAGARIVSPRERINS